MATISLKDIHLNQTSITGKRKQDVVLTDMRPRYAMDENRNRTDIIEGYNVDIVAARGMAQTVKLQCTLEAKVIEQISDAFANGKTVYVDFGTPSTLKGRPYAMLSDGRLLSGVSCTASELHIVKIEDDDEDIDFGTDEL